jgi:23S rRNA pseudouridine1911/1915/1917 synthase
MIHSFPVTDTDAGARLDVFLSAQMPDRTRSAIAKLLKAGAGKVNGKAASVHRFLKAGDEVALDDAVATRPPKRGHAERGPAPTSRPTKAPPLKIVAETDAWVVINKPAGLIVHPDAIAKTGTLVDALVAHDPRIAKVGDDPSRPGIVHRLDREVGGLMVIAKTQDAFDGLKRQFAEHSVDKRYLALVHGEIPTDDGDIKFRIARSKTKARMAARPESDEGGKAAWTHYKVIRRFRGATLLDLAILSGRTHQIRAHMLAFRHPILGDPLYNLKTTTRKLVSPRLLLQAVHLSFIDPATGETMTYDLKPDPAFDAAINKLS